MTEVKQAILFGMGIGLLCGIVVGPLLTQPQHPLTLSYDAPAAWRTAGRCENESTCFESYVNSGTESTIFAAWKAFNLPIHGHAIFSEFGIACLVSADTSDYVASCPAGNRVLEITLTPFRGKSLKREDIDAMTAMIKSVRPKEN